MSLPRIQAISHKSRFLARSFLRQLLLLALLLLATPWANAATRTLPTRIISFAPNLTESMFALGAGDRVVGISDFCRYPPEALDRRRCGTEISPNFETILSLRPDLILVEGRAEKMQRFAKNQKIPLINMTMNSMASVQADLLLLGERLGMRDAAASLTLQIASGLEEARVQTPDSARPKVFISIDRMPGSVGTPLTAGGGTFLDEMVYLAGGRNIFADRKEPYPRISKETLLVRQPDVILELRPGDALDTERRSHLDADWAPLASLPAVRNRRIIYLTEEYLLFAGPRMTLTAAMIRDALRDAMASPHAP